MTERPGDVVQCDLLDDYLSGELSASCRAEFEQHLATCQACRSAIDEWRTLCRDLEHLTSLLETPSPALLERVQSQATTSVSRGEGDSQKWRVAALLGASLVAVGLFAILLQPRPPREELATVPNARRQLPKPTVANLSPPPKLKFSDDVIGVPIDVGDPNVTVVWLYPTVQTASRAN